jgi:two-component system sensor histidine kinase KdpD
VALLYLLAVVLLALFVQWGAILFGTALTALGWSFLFAPPEDSFHIGNASDRMMLGTYFVVALTVGQLTARLRAQQLAEQRREEHATALYLLTRELADAANLGEILARAVEQAGTVFGLEVAILISGSNGKEPLTQFAGNTWLQPAADRSAAVWAFEHNQAAGRGTGAWLGTEGVHLPLSAGGTPSGVLGLRLPAKAVLTPEQRRLLDSFGRQIALVLDRQRLRDAEVKAKLLAESERLGRTLLNSISHELRTPIAAIATAAAILRTAGALTASQESLAAEIETATGRLNRVVRSLLSAARLQAGQIRPKLDWCEVSDLVRVSLREAEKLLAGRPVEHHVEPGLPLVKADFVLMQQALVDLLANAATHTPAGTPIEITARLEGGELLLEVADRGPGVPEEQLERLFELFQRAPNAKPGGTGLGLAIVKGFAEAQGGRVQAGNRPGGGAVFKVFLPMRDTSELQKVTEGIEPYDIDVAEMKPAIKQAPELNDGAGT